MFSRFWRIVLTVTGWHIVASVCYYAIYAGTPLFRDAFSLSSFEVGLVISALTLGYAIFLLPFGVATDRFGERRTLTAGLAGLASGVLLVAVAPTYWLFLAAVFLLGSMYGSATPGTNKAIFDQIDAERHHRAIGIKQIGPTVGSAIGAVLITGLAGRFFWQFGFLVAAGVGLITTVAFFFVYRRASRADMTSPGFRGLLSNRAYLVLLPAGMCIGAAFYTATGYTVLFIDESIGATVATGGLVLASVQVVNSAGKIGVGTLADILPGTPRSRTSAMLVVQAASGGVLFLLLPLTTTPLTAGLVFAGLGVFVLGSTGLYYSCISILVSDEKFGAASAAGQLAMTVSGLFAPPTFGYLIDVNGYGVAWTFLAGLSFVAAGLILLVVFEIV
ncbi:MFS transporter [Natrinema sp. 1APR25-10V2]|uniref:MFS transporter n=1 Tax=Natrinema sp. 1APR25-10V2 TaxID=2951081 RepID=UPI0028757E0C|nr:MFS transporter [Natrinema sp. 1APR25-10V2]MDS0474847.1 MFS transporter [Natrinema sp. 1APR25-10V2]